jgi:hypothetical protein
VGHQRPGHGHPAVRQPRTWPAASTTSGRRPATAWASTPPRHQAARRTGHRRGRPGCVADGQGGWFIGGDFKNVAGQFRRYAAQVTAAGAVTAWNPKPDQPRRGARLRRRPSSSVARSLRPGCSRRSPRRVARTGAANLVPGFQPAPTAG